MFYVYILECVDGTFYTGYTVNLEKRIQAHNSGKGSRYTRSRLPVKLIYKEEYKEKSEAMRREYAIKKMSHKDKEELMRKSLCEGRSNLASPSRKW